MRQAVRALLWALVTALASVSSLSSTTAFAQDEPRSWYAGPLAGFVIPDADRNASRGLNLQGVAGLMLMESVAVEGNLFFSSVSGAGGSDSINGFGADVVLGDMAAGNPFFMAGLGLAKQDVGGSKDHAKFANLGVGVYLPFSFAGEIWRLEGRYNLVFNENAGLPTQDVLEDGRVNLGFVMPFGKVQPAEEEEAPVEIAQPLPDADNDCVPDAQDQCPDTPRWVRPDERGCTPDSDGDGVDDAKDGCPATAAGAAVDGGGCPPAAASPQEQTQTLMPPPDADRDGIGDSLDACPHTSAGMAVDERGCLKPEKVVMGNVHFDLESARLTADGYELLHQLAAALRAHPDDKYEVAGYTDSSGSDAYNLNLSSERAQVVADFLTAAGVPAQQLTAKAYGGAQPTRSNKTKEGRAYNRRVEFHKK